MKEIEILAPAGSLESLYRAFQLGADAVYVGTSRFGARAFAKNPSVEELKEALTYAHLRNKKIYLTTNTLLEDTELEEELFPLIAPLYEAGLDACIVQDLGVLSFLHENFPGMDLHASTQMTLFSGKEAELYRPYGVTRFVPARELTLDEIKQARKETDLEIEVFVHGALCYCYSGQCLMSEAIGGRSGNRGMCAQPCRLPFRTSGGTAHYLSTKDICTLMYIPQLVDAGIDSFKIEGRMKRAEYSAYMAYLYRHYVNVYREMGFDYYRELVDNPESVLWKDYRSSMDLYNRGGFSDSYLFEKKKENMLYEKRNGHYGLRVGEVTALVQKKGKIAAAAFVASEAIHSQDVLEFRNEKDETIYEYTVKNPVERGDKVTANVLPGSSIEVGQSVYRTKNAQLLKKIQTMIESVSDKIGLYGSVTGRIGEPLQLQVEALGTKIVVSGDEVQKASKRPVGREDIVKRLDSLGNTKYKWEELNVSIEENAFLPLGGLKELRRRAIDAYESRAVIRRHLEKRTSHSSSGQKNGAREEEWMIHKNIISLADTEQIRAAVQEAKENTMFHLKLEDLPPEDWQTAVDFIADKEYAVSFPRVIRGNGKKVWEKMWKTYGSVFQNKKPSLFIINSHAMYLQVREWFPEIPMAAEENLYRKNERAKEVYRKMGIAGLPKCCYGRTAVMVTEGCVPGKCEPEQQRILLQTPKKDKFIVVKHCHYCYNTIYTEQPGKQKIKDGYKRLDFTLESAKEVREEIREWNF